MPLTIECLLRYEPFDFDAVYKRLNTVPGLCLTVFLSLCYKVLYRFVAVTASTSAKRLAERMSAVSLVSPNFLTALVAWRLWEAFQIQRLQVMGAN